MVYIQEKVQCPICGEFYKMITKGHLKKHGLTIPKFKELYPNFSMVSESLREAARLKAVEQWSHPEACADQSTRMSQWNKDHPEAGKAHSEWMKEYCEDPKVLGVMADRAIQWNKDHPECAKDHSDRMKKYNEDPEYRKRAREVRIEYLENNPDFSMRMSEIMLQWNKDHPEAGEAHSEWMLQYFIDNPEIGKDHSEWMIQYFKDNPELSEINSDKMKNSPACHATSQAKVGGHDICDHHMIYDHNDPKKYIIRITRSIHTKIHWMLRRLNIEVSHINVIEENRYIFKGRNIPDINKEV